MAEILRYRSGLPSFTEVLDIVSHWSELEKLSDEEKEKAKAELDTCIEALEGKSDGMSELVREKVEALLASFR